MTSALVSINHATYGGVYYCASFSGSGAEPTWSKLTTTGLDDLEVSHFQTDPDDPLNKQYVRCSTGSLFYRNGGNWSEILSTADAATVAGVNAANYSLQWLWADPTVPGAVYSVLTYTVSPSYGGPLYLMKSTDYGSNWTAHNFKSQGKSLGKVNVIGNNIWIACTGGLLTLPQIFHSPDGGTTWYSKTPSTGSSGITRISINRSNGSQCYTTDGTLQRDLSRYSYSGGSITSTSIFSNVSAGSQYQDGCHYIDNVNVGREVWVLVGQDGVDPDVRFTNNTWASTTTAAYNIGENINALANSQNEGLEALMVGTLNGSGVLYADDETDTTWTARNGSNHGTAPYTDSLPDVGNVSYYGVWFGVTPATPNKGINVFSVELGDITSIPDYAGLGVPLFGDRSSWRDMPDDGYDIYHAEDVEAGTPQIHVPWDDASPPGAGYGIVSDGSSWVITDDPLVVPGDLHDAVTLDADAAVILDLTGQEIGLDTQNANTVFAGPTAAPANEPTFRALVSADLPAITFDDLSDVDLTDAGDGDIVYLDSSTWYDYPLGIGTNFANEDGRIKIGDIAGGDYMEIDNESGEVTLIGGSTAFVDLLFPLIGQKLESPSSNITADNAEGALDFQDDCDLTDYVVTNVQLNHNWMIGSDIEPHLHWWQASADVPNWLIAYRWQIQGEAKTTSWTYQAYDSHAFTYSAGTLNQITSFGEIAAPAGAGLSDIVQFRILRDTADDSGEFGAVADPLAGDATAVQFDVHIEIDSFGSYTRYIKNYDDFLLLESGDFLLLESGDKLLLE